MKPERLKTLQEQARLRYTPKQLIVMAKVVKLKPVKQKLPCKTKPVELPIIDFEKVKYWAKKR